MLMRDEALSEQERIVVEEWVVYEALISSSLGHDLGTALEEVFAPGPGPAGAGVGAVEEGNARDGDGESLMAVKDHEGSRRDVCWIVIFSPTGCEELLSVLGHAPPSIPESPPLPQSSSSSPPPPPSSSSLKADGYNSYNNPPITWPTTIKNGPERTKMRERAIYIATIGPTTRDNLRHSLGFEPHVCARSPTPQGVGEGIRAFMRRD